MNGLQWRHGTAVDRNGNTLVKRDYDLVRKRRVGRIIRVVVDILGGGIPDVFKEPCLDCASPNILVNGEGVVLGCFNRQVMLDRVVDRHVAGEGEVANRCQTRQVGAHRSNSDLKPNLIIAFARATVRDGVRTKLAGSLH